jgi:integrase
VEASRPGDRLDGFYERRKQARRPLHARAGAPPDGKLPLNTAQAVEFSIYTGCRQFETYGLVWDDVHFDRCTYVVTVKGGKRKTKLLSPQTAALLERVKRRGRYVIDKRNRRRQFVGALSKLGLDDFRWHDLRHTHATWLRQAGVPIKVVQRSMGHAALSTTMIYAHVDDTGLYDALGKLPTIGGEGPPPKVASLAEARRARNGRK